MAAGGELTTKLIRVLYVDDEPELLHLATLYLQTYPELRIETVGSAQMALEQLSKEHDAIVSDFQMPGMDGLALLERLRREGNDIPFILFTGKGREEVVIQAINNGVDYYIQKGGEPKAQFAEVRHKIKLAVQRRRDAARICESESRFRGIIENAHAGYFLLDQDGRLIDVNRSWLNMYGFDMKGEVVGKDLLDLLAPESRISGTHMLEILLQGECTRPIDLHFTRKDGSEGTFTISASPVIEGLRMVGVEGFCFDVSTIKTIEGERDASKRRHDQLFYSMDEGVALHELVYRDGRPVDYVILDVNPAFERILGVDRTAVVGKRATDAYGTDGAPYLREYSTVAETGAPTRLEVFFEPMGRHFDISVTSSEKGQFATIFVDVTAAKEMVEEARSQNEEIQAQNEEIRSQNEEIHAQNAQLQAQREQLMVTYDKALRANQQLRSSEERWRSIIDATSDGVIEIDPVKREITINLRTPSLPGYSQGPYTSSVESYLDKIHPEDRSKVQDRMQRYLRGEGEAFISEHRVVGEDGHYYWSLVRMKIIDRDADGRPSRMLGTIQDINSSKVAEEALRTANRKLNLLNSITRHDLRNQLMVLQGHVALLKESMKEDEHLDSLHRMERTLRTIDHHIEFTKIYEHLGSERPRWQDMSVLSRRVLSDARTEGIKTHVELDGLEVYADPMLEKVLHNLTDNSLRHGGKVGCIKLTWSRQGDRAVITFQDDGKGIPPEYRESLFEKGKGHNTGLGLFLSKEILSITGIGIAEVGGGHGAKFEMTVPQGSFRMKGQDA